jgi:tRNA dimethylallyltransferase
VRQLREHNDLSPELPAIRAVGYRQVWQYLEGQSDEAGMIDAAVTATRQLAKRQLTWLRAETDAVWFDSEDPDLEQRVAACVDEFLD